VARIQQNYMVTEDSDLQYAVAELMKSHIQNWGKDPSDWLITIKRARGVDDALNHEILFQELKESGLKTLGIVVDGDNAWKEKWESIRDFCRKCNAQTPQNCPPAGLIVDRIIGESGVEARFGAWIMPNNQSDGMLENFCHAMIPAGNEKILDHAVGCVRKAKELGAPYNPIHHNKALMHTWLAWQDPPGERMGRAIANKILNPNAESAKSFVTWFRKLYGV
jgi:hypothetical protein